jgi:hypothetical protein
MMSVKPENESFSIFYPTPAPTRRTPFSKRSKAIKTELKQIPIPKPLPSSELQQELSK